MNVSLLLLVGWAIALSRPCFSLENAPSSSTPAVSNDVTESPVWYSSFSKGLQILASCFGLVSEEPDCGMCIYELRLAIEYSTLSDVDFLLKKYSPVIQCLRESFVPEPGLQSTTLLHFAIEREKSRLSLDIVTRLLTEQAPVNAKNGAGQTPLHLVLQQPHHELSSEYLQTILSDNSVDVNATNCAGETPLHLVLQMPPSALRSEYVKKILNIPVDVNALDNQRKTPLQRLPEAQSRLDLEANFEMIKLLDQAGLDCSIIDNIDIYGLPSVPGRDKPLFTESKVLFQSVVGLFSPRLITEDVASSVERDIECPISIDVPENPVLASDGMTYNFDHLDSWAAKSNGEIQSPIIVAHSLSRIVYSNVIVAKMVLEWDQLLQAEEEPPLVAQWKDHEKLPYLCRDGKIYAFDDIPKQFLRESSCYVNNVLHQLAMKASELRQNQASPPNLEGTSRRRSRRRRRSHHSAKP